MYGPLNVRLSTSTKEEEQTYTYRDAHQNSSTNHG